MRHKRSSSLRPSALARAAALGLVFSSACKDCDPRPKHNCGELTCKSDQVCDPEQQVCRAPRTCADLDCSAHRVCEQSKGGDAVCLEECDPGFAFIASTGSCSAVAGSCGAAGCDAEGRACQTVEGGFACGACVSGYVEVAGKCEVFKSCSALNCQAQGLDCSEDPNGHCLGCLDGLVEEQGRCRPPKTCSQLACASGACNETDGRSDAFCGSECEGYRRKASDSPMCRFCGPCDELAKAGVSTGKLLDGVSSQGQCYCEPAPGYFIDQASTSLRACDQDGDGWINESAHAAMSAADAYVRGSAACIRRVASAFVLHGDADGRNFPSGGAKRVSVSVALVEIDRNDSDEALRFDRARSGLPQGYGRDAQGPSARELNALTKYCTDARADFNGDGASDVDQAWEGEGSARKHVYARFAYFSELHWGWWEPGQDAAADCGLGSQAHPRDVCGAYHVAERPRGENWPDGRDARADRVPFGYVEGPGQDYVGEAQYRPKPPHWQRCERIPDQAFAARPPVRHTMDLAEFGQDLTVGFPGMRHHSQFKCVRIVTAGDDAARDATQLQAISEEEVLHAEGLAAHARWQSCALTAPALPAAVGPAQPRVVCSPEPRTPALRAGDVRWLAVTYDAAKKSVGQPERGCINECAAQRTLPPTQRCPGSVIRAPDGQWVQGPRGAQHCSADELNFGRLACGCNENFGGAACEFVCSRAPAPDESANPDTAAYTQKPGYMTGANFDANGDVGDTRLANGSPRMGYWACLKQRGAVSRAYEWSADGSTFRLQGMVRKTSVRRVVMKPDPADAGDFEGYAVY